MIQVSFRTQGPNIKTGTIRDPHQNSQLIHDPLCFQIPPIRSTVYGKEKKQKTNNPCAKLRRLIHTLCVSDSLRIYLFPLRRAAGIKKYPDSLSIRKPISPLGKQRLFLQAQAL